MRPRRLAALLLGAVLLAPAVVGPVTASPMPTSVCSPCDRGFEAATESHDLDVRIQRSTATVRVHANGSATWTVRNRLSGADVSAFVEDPALLEQVASEALGHRGVAVHRQTLLGVEAGEGDVVVVRYRTPDFAHRTLGVLRSDHFRDRPGAYLLTDLGADRLTVVAPEGTAVAAGVPGASVEGREMTLRAFESAGDGPFVVIAPEGAALGGLRAQLAIGLALAPIVAKNLLWLVLVPVGLLTAAFAATSRGVAAGVPTASATRARRAGVVVAGLGALAALLSFGAPTAVGGVHASAVLLAGGVGTAAVGGVAAWRPDRFGRREHGLALVGGLALGGIAALARSAVGGLSLHGAGIFTVALPLLSLLGLPLGHVAAHRGRRHWLLALAGIAGLYALLVVLTRPMAEMGGTLYFLGPILLSILAVLAGVLAVPLLALGALLPGDA